MAIPEVSSPEAVRNHWWWRPGWRQGRHFYACHFTLEDQPEMRNLARHYQDAVAGLPTLDLIPAPWLHLTMQGIGFVDKIDSTELARVTEHLQDRLARFPAPTVAFQWPTLRPEAAVLVADPQYPLYLLRLAMHEAIAAALPATAFSEPQPSPGEFIPHVSFAYVNSDGAAQPIVDAILSARAPEPVSVTFSAASLLVFHRDHRMYEWTRAAPVPLKTT